MNYVSPYIIAKYRTTSHFTRQPPIPELKIVYMVGKKWAGYDKAFWDAMDQLQKGTLFQSWKQNKAIALRDRRRWTDKKRKLKRFKKRLVELAYIWNDAGIKDAAMGAGILAYDCEFLANNIGKLINTIDYAVTGKKKGVVFRHGGKG